MNSDLHLDDMLVFSRVAAQKGFNAASRQFGMSKQTISRRIAMLEANLGVKLIERNTRTFELTSEGRIYFEDCRHIISEVQQANRRIKEGRSCVGGVLNLELPSALMHTGVMEMIKRFCSQNPHIQVYLLDQYECVDADTIDIQICIDFGLVAQPIAANLGYAAFDAFVSPAYPFKIHPQGAGDTFKFIASDEKLQPNYLKNFADYTVGLKVRTFAQVLQATIAGFGVGYLPVGLARSAVQENKLYAVNLPSAKASFPIKILPNQKRKPKESVLAFYEHLERNIAHNPIWDGLYLDAENDADSLLLDCTAV